MGGSPPLPSPARSPLWDRLSLGLVTRAGPPAPAPSVFPWSILAQAMRFSLTLLEPNHIRLLAIFSPTLSTLREGLSRTRWLPHHPGLPSRLDNSEVGTLRSTHIRVSPVALCGLYPGSPPVHPRSGKSPGAVPAVCVLSGTDQPPLALFSISLFRTSK